MSSTRDNFDNTADAYGGSNGQTPLSKILKAAQEVKDMKEENANFRLNLDSEVEKTNNIIKDTYKLSPKEEIAANALKIPLLEMIDIGKEIADKIKLVLSESPNAKPNDPWATTPDLNFVVAKAFCMWATDLKTNI